MTDTPTPPESTNPGEHDSPPNYLERDLQSFELLNQAYKQNILRQATIDPPEGYVYVQNVGLKLYEGSLQAQILQQSGLDIRFVHPTNTSGRQGSADGLENLFSLYMHIDDRDKWVSISVAGSDQFAKQIDPLTDGRKAGGYESLMFDMCQGVSPYIDFLDQSRLDSNINSNFGRALANSEDPHEQQLIKRAFLTAMLVKKTEKKFLDDQEVDLVTYQKIREEGLTPLGIEELFGITQTELNQIYEASPGLRPTPKTIEDDFDLDY